MSQKHLPMTSMSSSSNKWVFDKMDKKGQAFKILNMSFSRLLFLTFMLFTVYLMVHSQVKSSIDVSELQNLIITKRMLYGSSFISYTDPVTLRTYPGIVDLNKFSQLNLDLNSPESPVQDLELTNIAVKMELTDLETTVPYEAYINKKWYDRWSPLTSFDNYDSRINRRFVLIKNGNTVHKGLLRLHVVVHKG